MPKKRVKAKKPAKRTQPAKPTERRRNGKNTSRRALVENQIIQEASRLFAERGFAGTTLQDLADALGMNRSALYYYVSSKEDILSRLISDMTQHAASETRAIAEDPALRPAEKLAAIVRSIAHQRAKDPVRFLFLIRSQSSLPGTLAQANREAEREVHRNIMAVLEAGVRIGEFRSIEPRTSALAVVGMCNWIAWWAREREADTADAIADAFVDLALAMVARTDDRVPQELSAQGALALVREDLALLEAVLGVPLK